MLLIITVMTVVELRFCKPVGTAKPNSGNLGLVRKMSLQAERDAFAKAP